ncbi:MAG: N-acetyltransferase [Woeseiaceae bacterium]|nr:N-acetyltransferase [Woeseiaceae bacterium]
MLEITREDSATKGRYVARVPGHEETGELTFSKLGSKTVIADHTGVPETLRGQGIAKALVDRLVADARAEGFKIVPLCPYIRARLPRHPEWADVLQTN